MYAIHTTDGFIVDSRPYGDADKLITIFTRDFGLITATALSIRKESSKLRYHCQDYSFGRYSLVRGKEFWRLTSAAEDTLGLAQGGYSTKNSYNIQPAADLLIARLAQLLRRLLHGEEANPDLFEIVEETARFLSRADTDMNALESITVLRILHVLGYVGHDVRLGQYLSYTELTPALVTAAAAQRTAINLHINKALKESHL